MKYKFEFQDEGKGFPELTVIQTCNNPNDLIVITNILKEGFIKGFNKENRTVVVKITEIN